MIGFTEYVHRVSRETGIKIVNNLEDQSPGSCSASPQSWGIHQLTRLSLPLRLREQKNKARAGGNHPVRSAIRTILSQGVLQCPRRLRR